MSDGATIDPTASSFIITGVLGVHTVSGFAKGSRISIEYITDEVALLEGVDEEALFIDSKSRAANATLTLLQSSDSNDVLSSYVALNRNRVGGLGFGWGLAEINGRTIYATKLAKVAKLANGTWSDGGEVRVWTILIPRLVGFVGGLNATPTS